jgi:hypothetical protein
MSRDDINLIKPIQNRDFFARFLRETLGLNPVSFGLWVLFLDLVVDAWLGYHYNVWFSPPGARYPGLLQDFTALVVDFGSIPLMAGLYLWSTEGATHLFRKLQQSGVFQSKAVIPTNVEQSRPAFESSTAFYLITLVAVLYAISQLAAYQNWVPWSSAGGYLNLLPAGAYYRTLFWLLNFYTFLFTIYNIIITVVTLRRLFQTRGIRILPLHPDKCGGVVSISQYTVKIAYGIASAGLVISGAAVFALQTKTLAQAYPILLGIVAYLVFAPLLFFWPLGTAHAAMQDAKERQLLQLAQRYNDVYTRLNTASEGEAAFEKDIKKLENIRKLYGIAQEFPVWPFDISTVRRFFALITAPLLPAFISIAIDLLKSYFHVP